jgi:hypothetical protein
MTDAPHPNAGKTCRCRRGKASAIDGKCRHCRSNREQKIVVRMRDGWTREAAQRGYQTDLEKHISALDDLD